jgi:hypothetical protein
MTSIVREEKGGEGQKHPVGRRVGDAWKATTTDLDHQISTASSTTRQQHSI